LTVEADFHRLRHERARDQPHFGGALGVVTVHRAAGLEPVDVGIDHAPVLERSVHVGVPEKEAVEREHQLAG
jgi:hypothetical protein